MNHVTLEMQGIRLSMRSAYAPLIDYVPRHLPDHVVTGGDPQDPHIEVDVQWIEGREPEPGEMQFPGQDGLDRIGKRLLAGPNCLVWTDTLRIKNLVLRFEMHGERLRIQAIYHYNPRKKKVEEQPHYRSKKFFGLMSWFVYHPLAWYLERFRGLYLLHASGIEMAERGIVIGGVGGVGKTTTGVSLLAQGGRLVSENLIFFDAERIYSCYEPIRLDDHSVEILADRRDILKPATIPEGSNHKNLYQVDRRLAVVESAAATALFLPRFTSEGAVREIPVDACIERLVAFNTLTREVNDYEWFAATLNVAWAAPGAQERRLRTLRAFLERMGRWELGIDRRQGVEPVVTQILERTMTGSRT